MRITVNIDEDVILAAKAIARRKKQTMGKVLSDLARESLIRQESLETRNEVPLFPKKEGAQVITLELANQLRDGLL